jgi:putative FmdB family regulatory protein
MPVYEYRCTTCHVVYDERRPMADADAPAACPAGHVGGARLLPIFAATGRATPPRSGGACGAPVAGGCGSGCACC